MNSLCTVCFSWNNHDIPRICSRCYEALPLFQGQSPAHCVYRYEGVIRKLIWRAKIKGDFAAASLISDLATRSDEVATLVAWADVIVPSPSSLWGRIRGRFDVACGIAHAVAVNSGKPVISAPLRRYFRWKKRSKQSSRRPCLSDLHRITGERQGGRRALIVDDVITSGATFRDVAEGMRSDAVKFMAFAAAHQ